MGYQFSCGDVMPGCQAQFRADSTEQLMREVSAHAAADHGIDEVTPDIASAVEAKITED